MITCGIIFHEHRYWNISQLHRRKPQVTLWRINISMEDQIDHIASPSYGDIYCCRWDVVRNIVC